METAIAHPRLRQERFVKEAEYNPMSDPKQVMIFILASDFGVTLEELSLPCRVKEIRWLRQAVQVVLKNNSNLSLSAIGVLTGKDHATIIHSCKVVQNDVFVFNHQGVSSTLLDTHNKIQKKFLRLYKPIKKRR